MVKISLPDGNSLSFAEGVSGSNVAQKISKRLFDDALAIEVESKVFDLSHIITKDASVRIITSGMLQGLDLIRHSCAHLLAAAVKELYPEAKAAIGPVISNGFYYDFYRDEPFTTNDLELIENRMRQIRNKTPITRRELSREQAIALFKSLKEDFKVELINDLPVDSVISVYDQGNFTDLCRGPHVPSVDRIPDHFKLTKVSGAYWRGDSSKPMLQRIYGTVWATKSQLDLYIKQITEAEARDHRKLGREMDLFHIQDEAVGSVFWHPNGHILYRILEDFIRSRVIADGYVEVKTPQLIDRTLWERSGHWDKFREVMFIAESEKRVLAVKPMSCPGHIQIFNQSLKSYRQLPYRIAEFGACHRNEPSGSLHGLMRVRAFTQDDGHIFCTMDQVVSEAKKFCDLLISIYKDFGFKDISIRFADRPKVRAGDDETWDRAEKALKDAVKEIGLDFTYSPGEGAFYGPKLEFGLNDALGRYWQCGTLQVDLILPERLSAEYVGEDGSRHRPVMLHRAALGSLERFVGILLEHYAGRLPMWLAPIQAVIIPVVSTVSDYAEEVRRQFLNIGVRCHTDLRSESTSYKIREHSVSKVPLLIMVGPKEVENKTVSTRKLGNNGNQEILTLQDLVKKLSIEALPPSL